VRDGVARGIGGGDPGVEEQLRAVGSELTEECALRRITDDRVEVSDVELAQPQPVAEGAGEGERVAGCVGCERAPDGGVALTQAAARVDGAAAGEVEDGDEAHGAGGGSRG
jgi:hypothetical protein